LPLPESLKPESSLDAKLMGLLAVLPPQKEEKALKEKEGE